MLNLAPKLKLPPEAALQRYGILAMSGAGKSNTSVVMAEEFYDAGIPWVAIDPKGDWWGIRASASGKGTGLEVPVFGGLHGDLPLEEEAGAMMAELIAETRLTCILDVSEMSKGAQLRFLTDFAETLLRRNREPLHVFAEEADEYLPQRVMKREAQCVGAWSKLVKRGRFRGIFVTLISQRSAALNNEALSQVDTLMPMRTAAPSDKKAIEAWVVAHDFGRDLIDSLPELKDGELWVWSPHKLGLSKRVRFRRRRTFDSGETPGLEGSREPAKLADIDLDDVRERMADTIEKAEAEDPKRLQRELAAAQRELQEWKTAGLGRDEKHGTQLEWTSPEALAAELANRAKAEAIEVPVPVVEEETAQVLTSVLRGLGEGLKVFQGDIDRVEALVNGAGGQKSDISVTKSGAGDSANGSGAPTGARPRRDIDVPPPGPPPAAPTATGEGSEDLGLAERKILGVLAQFPGGRSKVQIAILTGYSAKSGGFNNALGKLRTKDLITPARVEPVKATAAGLAAAGDVEPLPTGSQLLAYWCGKLGKAEREVLTVLYGSPGGLSKEEIGQVTGYSVTSGGFNNALGKLRSLELISAARIEPITISEVFLV